MKAPDSSVTAAVEVGPASAAEPTAAPRTTTPAPIAGTSYEDKTVTPGVRYVYAIVAVDKASPPNRSAPSLRVEETAR